MPEIPGCVDLENTAPIEETDPVVADMLGKLQGNILKGHGRDHSVHLFFQFGDDAGAVRRGLRDLAAQYVTDACRQLQCVDDFNAYGIPGPLFGNLFLSAEGFGAFALKAPGPQNALLPMRQNATAFLPDPDPSEWESGYREPIHAMLLLADDDAGYLMRETRRAVDSIRRHSSIVHVERGRAIRNAQEETIEHFGYVDGRSQPLYLARDFRRDPAGGMSDDRGHPVTFWNPFEPLSRVLVRDDRGGANCFGSFFVFRKLEQNVRGFVRAERELAQKLFGSATPENQDRAGALVVGRFRDGSPVALSGRCGHQPEQANDFLHWWTTRGVRVGDAAGHCCPFQAHTRKVNPRGETGKPDEREHRITRRGITYGDRAYDVHTANLDELPTAGVGLLFQCFQADLWNQFAFIQREWCNASDFVEKGTGADALIGIMQKDAPAHRWSSAHGSGRDIEHPFHTFIRMRGGEYFFAPSIPFFAGLA